MLEFIEQISLKCDVPTGDKFLDDLYDSSGPYYRFLYHLTSYIKPRLAIELGTMKGISLAYIARGTTSGKVVSVDHQITSEASNICSSLPNATLLCSKSEDAIEYIPECKTQGIDFLYVDTDHTYDQANLEYKIYKPLMNPGGIIVYDDISLNDGMKKFWESIKEPKVSLPVLHWTGFGVILV